MAPVNRDTDLKASIGLANQSSCIDYDAHKWIGALIGGIGAWARLILLPGLGRQVQEQEKAGKHL